MHKIPRCCRRAHMRMYLPPHNLRSTITVIHLLSSSSFRFCPSPFEPPPDCPTISHPFPARRNAAFTTASATSPTTTTCCARSTPCKTYIPRTHRSTCHIGPLTPRIEDHPVTTTMLSNENSRMHYSTISLTSL